MSGKSWCFVCEAFACEADANGVRRCPIHGVRPQHGEVRVFLERLDHGPYLSAEIDVTHNHGCAATRWGKKHGPCDCGGQELMDRFLADHADDPWGAVARRRLQSVDAEPKETP